MGVDDAVQRGRQLKFQHRIRGLQQQPQPPLRLQAGRHCLTDPQRLDMHCCTCTGAMAPEGTPALATVSTTQTQCSNVRKHAR